MMSTLECLSCGFKTINFEKFGDLSLDLTRQSSSTRFFKRIKLKLEDIISSYFNKEIISDYNCMNCRRRVDIEKKDEIIKYPNILIINIKRFEFYPFAKKLDNKVMIKEEIDLKDYFVNKNCDKSASAQKFIKKERDKGKYVLRSFIEHSGKINFGHYISYCYSKEEEGWLIFNDTRVTNLYKSDFIENKESGAYVLFYERLSD